MPERRPRRARGGARTSPVTGLVAVEGVHGPDVAAAASTLAHELTAAQVASGISRWDASGLFGDVATAGGVRDVSPRTLMLLYAADLAFRLRWEIAPALESGLIVIAAPYVDTAIAFGVAAGLPGDWLHTLFRFAPAPARTVVLRDRRPDRVWKRHPDRGLGEFAATLLDGAPQPFGRKKARRTMSEGLADTAERHGGLVRRKELPSVAVAIVTARSQPPVVPPDV